MEPSAGAGEASKTSIDRHAWWMEIRSHISEDSGSHESIANNSCQPLLVLCASGLEDVVKAQLACEDAQVIAPGYLLVPANKAEELLKADKESCMHTLRVVDDVCAPVLSAGNLPLTKADLMPLVQSLFARKDIKRSLLAAATTVYRLQTALPTEYSSRPHATARDDVHCNSSSYPSFRATGQRRGHHDFDSLQLASAAGAGVNEATGWPVKLEGYIHELLLSLDEHHLEAMLTSFRHKCNPKKSKQLCAFRSYRQSTGAISLKSSTASSMLRFLSLHQYTPSQPLKLVDLCGGSGIVCLEAAEMLGPRLKEAISGDNDEQCVANAQINCAALADTTSSSEAQVYMQQWDVTDTEQMKRRVYDGSVDAVVTDLPFGVRTKISTVRSVYAAVVRECARILKPDTGEAVILAAGTAQIERSLAGTSLRVQHSRKLVLEGLSVHLLKLSNDIQRKKHLRQQEQSIQSQPSQSSQQ